MTSSRKKIIIALCAYQIEMACMYMTSDTTTKIRL